MRIKNILLVLLTITTIASTSLAVYFGINQKKRKRVKHKILKHKKKIMKQYKIKKNKKNTVEYLNLMMKSM